MIEQIYQLGDDALQNFFEVTIPAIAGVSMDNIVLRSTDINIPQSGVNTYEIPFKTQKVAKIGGKIDLTTTFSMSFRVDRYYEEYKKLVTWKNMGGNPHTGEIATDNITSSAHRVDIEVHPIDSDGLPIDGALYWIMHYAFLKTIPDIRFDYNNGDPIIVSLTFEFTTLEEVM
jgi:hypothetical protein